MGRHSRLAAAALLVVALLGAAHPASARNLDFDNESLILETRGRQLLNSCTGTEIQLNPTAAGVDCVADSNHCPYYSAESTGTTGGTGDRYCTCNADRLFNIHTNECVTPTDCMHHGEMEIDSGNKLCRCRSGMVFNTFFGTCMPRADCPTSHTYVARNETCGCAGTNDWYLPQLNSCIPESNCPRRYTENNQLVNNGVDPTWADTNLEGLTTGFNLDAATRTFVKGDGPVKTSQTLTIDNFWDIQEPLAAKAATGDGSSERERWCDCAQQFEAGVSAANADDGDAAARNVGSDAYVLLPQYLCVDPMLPPAYQFKKDRYPESSAEFARELDIIKDRILTDVIGAKRDIRQVGLSETSLNLCQRAISCLSGMFYSPMHGKCIKAADCPLNMTTTAHGETGPVCFCQEGWVWEPTFKMCRPRDCADQPGGSTRPVFNWHTWTCDTGTGGAATEEKFEANSGCPSGATLIAAVAADATDTTMPQTSKTRSGQMCHCPLNTYYNAENNKCVSVVANTNRGSSIELMGLEGCPKGSVINEADGRRPPKDGPGYGWNGKGPELFKSCACALGMIYIPGANVCKSSVPTGETTQTTNYGLATGPRRQVACQRGFTYEEHSHSCIDLSKSGPLVTAVTGYTKPAAYDITCPTGSVTKRARIAHDDYLGIFSDDEYWDKALDTASAAETSHVWGRTGAPTQTDVKVKEDTLAACYGEIQSCVCAPHQVYDSATDSCIKATAPYRNACIEAGVANRPYEVLGHMSNFRYGAAFAAGGGGVHAHTDFKCVETCPLNSVTDTVKKTCTCAAGYILDRDRNMCVNHVSQCARGFSQGVTVVQDVQAGGNTMNGPAELNGLAFCGCTENDFYWAGRHICSSQCPADAAGVPTGLSSKRITVCDQYFNDEECVPAAVESAAPHKRCGCYMGDSDTHVAAHDGITYLPDRPIGEFKLLNAEGYWQENVGRCVGYCPLDNSVMDTLKRTCKCKEGYWYDAERHLCHQTESGCPANSYKYPRSATSATSAASYPSDQDINYNDNAHVCACDATQWYNYPREKCMDDDSSYCPYKLSQTAPFAAASPFLLQTRHTTPYTTHYFGNSNEMCGCPATEPWFYKSVDDNANAGTTTLNADYKNSGICLGSCPKGSTINRDKMTCNACSGYFHVESHKCIADSGTAFNNKCGDARVTTNVAGNAGNAVDIQFTTQQTIARDYKHVKVCSCKQAGKVYNYQLDRCQDVCPPGSTYDTNTNVCKCPTGTHYAPGIDACISDCPSNADTVTANSDYNNMPTCICPKQTSSTDAGRMYMLTIGASFVSLTDEPHHAGTDALKATTASADLTTAGKNAHNNAVHLCISHTEIPVNTGQIDTHVSGYSDVGRSTAAVTTAAELRGIDQPKTMFVTFNRAAGSTTNANDQAVTYNDVACDDYWDPVRRWCVDKRYDDANPTRYACQHNAVWDTASRSCQCPQGTGQAKWTYLDFPYCIATCPSGQGTAAAATEYTTAGAETTVNTCVCGKSGSVQDIWDFHRNVCVREGWDQDTAAQGGGNDVWQPTVDTTATGAENRVPRGFVRGGVLQTGTSTAGNVCTDDKGCNSGGVALCSSSTMSTTAAGYYDPFRHMCVNGCPTRTHLDSTEGCPAGTAVTVNHAADECGCSSSGYFFEYLNRCYTQAECEAITGAEIVTTGQYNKCQCATATPVYEFGSHQCVANTAACDTSFTKLTSTATDEMPNGSLLKAKFGGFKSTCTCPNNEIYDPLKSGAKNECKKCPKNAVKTLVEVSTDTALATTSDTPVADATTWKCSCDTSGTSPAKYLWPALWDNVGCTTCPTADGMTADDTEFTCSCSGTKIYFPEIHKCVDKCGGANGFTHTAASTNTDFDKFAPAEVGARWSQTFTNEFDTNRVTGATETVCACPTANGQYDGTPLRYMDQTRNVCIPNEDQAVCSASGSFYIPHLDNAGDQDGSDVALGSGGATYRVCIETQPTDSVLRQSDSIAVCPSSKPYYFVPTNACVTATDTDTCNSGNDDVFKDDVNKLCRCDTGFKYDQNQKKCVANERCPVNGFEDNFNCFCSSTSALTQYLLQFAPATTADGGKIPNICAASKPEGATCSSANVCSGGTTADAGSAAGCGTNYYNLHEHKCQALSACPKQMKKDGQGTHVEHDWVGVARVCACDNQGAFKGNAASSSSFISALYYDTRDSTLPACVDRYECQSNNDRDDWLGATTREVDGDATDVAKWAAAGLGDPTLPSAVSRPVAGDNTIAFNTMGNVHLTCKCPAGTVHNLQVDACVPKPSGSDANGQCPSGQWYNVHTNACVGAASCPKGAIYVNKAAADKVCMCADLNDYNAVANSCQPTVPDNYACSFTFPPPPPVNLLGSRIEFGTKWPDLNCGDAHDIWMRGDVVASGNALPGPTLAETLEQQQNDNMLKRNYLQYIRDATCLDSSAPVEVGVSHVTCDDKGFSTLHTYVVFPRMNKNETVDAFVRFINDAPQDLLVAGNGGHCDEFPYDTTLHSSEGATSSSSSEESSSDDSEESRRRSRALLQDGDGDGDGDEEEADEGPQAGTFGSWGSYTIIMDSVLTMRTCDDYPWKMWILAFFIIFAVLFCCVSGGLIYLIRKHQYLCWKDKDGGAKRVSKKDVMPMPAAEA